MASVDFFQNDSWTVHSGWEAVWEAGAGGRRGVKALAELLKARAQLEEEYARQLARLPRAHPVSFVAGSLTAAAQRFAQVRELR